LPYYFFGKYTEFLGNTPIPRKMSRGGNDLEFRWGVFDLVFLAELFSFLPAVLPACLPAVWVRLPACYPLTSADLSALRY
jgi:hypothetical protein